MALSYEFIASYTAPSNQQYITFNNIPSIYKHLYLKGNVRSSRNGGDDGGLQWFYNNSQAANYTYSHLFLYYAAVLSSGRQTTDTTYHSIIGVPQVAGSAEESFGFNEIFIPNYSTGSRYHPSLAFAMNTRKANPGGVYGEGSGLRYVVDAIGRIDLMTDQAGATFMTGSNFYLYGIKGQ